jgi:hypothetical protein
MKSLLFVLALSLSGSQDTAPPKQEEKQTNPPIAQTKKAEIQVFVDGEPIKFGANTPRQITGKTMVPFRPLFEALGAQVDYDLVHKAITAEKDDIKIELMIGDKIGKKNGAEINMGTAPVLIKGTSYVPLRFIAESLEAEVAYDQATQVITIKTKEDTY